MGEAGWAADYRHPAALWPICLLFWSITRLRHLPGTCYRIFAYWASGNLEISRKETSRATSMDGEDTLSPGRTRF